jgi:hypothetical protein
VSKTAKFKPGQQIVLITQVSAVAAAKTTSKAPEVTQIIATKDKGKSSSKPNQTAAKTKAPTKTAAKQNKKAVAKTAAKKPNKTQAAAKPKTKPQSTKVAKQ